MAFDQNAIQDHGERQRQHGEENLPVPGHQQPENHGDRHGGDHPQANQRQRVGDTQKASPQADGITAEAIEQALPEGHQTGAHQHHYAHHYHTGRQSEGQGEHQPVGAELRGYRHRNGNGNQGQFGSVCGHYIFLATARPKSPWGRNTSTAAITA